MLNRLTLVRFVVPLLATGALVFGARARAAESDGRLVAAASPVSRKPMATAAKRPAAAAHAAPKPATPAPAPAAAPGARQVIAEDQAWGQVSAENVNIRTGPNTQAAIVATVKGGEYVKARALQSGWYEIQWPQNVPAWVGKEFVQANGGSGTISSATVKVYSAGTPQSTQLAKLDKGAAITIVGEEGNWYKIKAPEAATAYIFARYVIAGVEAPSAAANKPAVVASAPVAAPAAKLAVVETAPAAKPALVETAPATKPAPATPAAPAEPNEAVQASLLATIENTRQQLRDAETARQAAAAQKKDAEEQARREEDTRRVAEIEAAESRKKIEAEAQAARETEARKKAEAEEQAKRDAEQKRLAEVEAAEAKKKLEAEELARRETEARKKAEAEETARREAELKRSQEIELARIAAETKKKADDEEQARRETERKRVAELEASETKKKLEAEELAKREVEARKKAEAEEQSKRESEAKLVAEREAAEAQKKIAAEELAKKDAEAKRIEQLEAARIAAETKKKAEVEEQARREAELKKKAADEEQAVRDAESKRVKEIEAARLATEAETKAKKPAEEVETARPKIEEPAIIKIDDDRGGIFIDPSLPRPTPPAKLEPVEHDSHSFNPLPAPARSAPLIEKSEESPTSIAYKPLNLPPAEPVAVDLEEKREAAQPVPPLPDANKRVRAKFVMPSREPSKPGKRAEIVDLGAGDATEDPAPLPTTPLLKPADVLEAPSQDALPAPTSAAPASIRLQPHFESSVQANAGGPVITSDGTVERASLSPAQGADYTLVRDGRTLHYLTAREGVNLENYVGRKITITGVAMQSSASDASILEVSSVTSRE